MSTIANFLLPFRGFRNKKLVGLLNVNLTVVWPKMLNLTFIYKMMSKCYSIEYNQLSVNSFLSHLNSIMNRFL